MNLRPTLLFFLFIHYLIGFAQESPYPQSQVIEKVDFNWSTHMRLATGSDNWPVTWADDNHQYVVWGDGGGFGGTNGIGRSSIGVARIEDNWHDFKPTNIWGGYNTPNAHNVKGKSYGIVCIDKVLYMWTGMFDTQTDPFKEAKIAYSKDHGETWTFVDWTLNRTDNIMMPTFCNYGRNYSNAKDDFVYSYLIRFQSYEGPDDYEDKADYLNCQKPGLIDLARVYKDSILFQQAYTFFAGMRNDQPTWTADLTKRKAVFENPDGVGWCINVIHNNGIGRYLLTSEHTESHRGKFSIFDAPEPWGPWTTVLYESDWGAGHIPLNSFYWNFSNKWTSENGKDFSLIFTGRKENDSFNLISGKFILK